MVKKSSNKSRSLLKCCQSGQISPHLVTLVVVFNKDEVTCFVKRIVKWPFIIIIIVVVVVIVVVALTFDNILRDVENSIFYQYVRPVFLQLTSDRGK